MATAGWKSCQSGKTLLWFMAVIGLVLIWALPLDRMPSACMSRQLFGASCPGCGTGRALHSLAHGDVTKSLRYHPLVLPIILFTAGWILVNRLLKNRGGFPFEGRAAIITLVFWSFLMLAVWLFRMSSGTLP